MHNCIHAYKQAYDAFVKIKHLRGTALSARGMVNIYNRMMHNQTNIAMDEEDSDSFRSEDVSWNSDESEQQSQDEICFDISKNIFKLTKTYRQSLQSYYREQAVAERDSCISRKQGEEFSLLTEIAKSATVQFLFGGIKRMGGNVPK